MPTPFGGGATSPTLLRSSESSQVEEGFTGVDGRRRDAVAQANQEAPRGEPVCGRWLPPQPRPQRRPEVPVLQEARLVQRRSTVRFRKTNRGQRKGHRGGLITKRR